MKISPARVAAFEILSRIESDKAFSSVLLPQYEEPLSRLDAALCHEIVLGTLRKQIYLDRLIDVLTNAKKLDIAVRIPIRLGLYQLLFLAKTPSHAIVNDSVELAVRAKKSSARSLINAVLRRATREVPKIIFTDEIDRISVETSHPRWLIERWITQFGVEEIEALAAANNERPRVAFRLIDEHLPVHSSWTPSNIVPDSFWTDRFDDELRDLEKDGRIYFQDEASQLVATSVAVPDGGTFLDVCAAPGGKTGIIAHKAPKAGMLVAGDIHFARVRHLRENLRRQGIDAVDMLEYDAESLPFADETFTSVLVDAPCTGTGTIRHNPEIRYFLSPDDPIELSNKQHQILINASKVLKPGGTLVYSTCSLEREENEGVITRLLGSMPDFQLVEPPLPERFLTSEGFGRTWPQRDQMDGFFIAFLTKGRF